MKDFIPYEEALELKQLGFDEDCFARYEGKLSSYKKPLIFEFTFANSPAAFNKVGYPNYPYQDVESPTFSQAFRFFREKYGLNHEIPYAGREGEYHAFVQNYIYGNNGNSPSVFTYEEAELECLRKLIQIIKQKQ